MCTVGIVSVVALAAFGGLEKEIGFEPMVEVVRVQSARAAGGAKRTALEITFNLVPDLPKGVRVVFELQRGGLSVHDENGANVTQVFTLDSEVRNNLKLAWTPKVRLTCDKYILTTKIPLREQTPEVRMAIEGKSKRFPLEFDPWPWHHPKQEFLVGTPQDELAEAAEAREYFGAQKDKLIELNNEAVDEVEKAKSGKGEPEALKKFLSGWMGRMAAVQKSLSEYPDKEPGLYSKNLKLHREVQDLGRMVAKRVVRTELTGFLKSKGLVANALRLPAVEGFDATFQYAADGFRIRQRVDTILLLLSPQDAPAADPEAAADGKEGSQKDAGADPEVEKADPAGDPADAEPKARPAGKGQGAKDGKKSPAKKAAPSRSST